VRKEIDQKIKDLLYRQGYNKSDIAISPSYPMARLTVQYTNTMQTKDNFKIEIGYLRRYPILKTDSIAEFRHLGTQESFSVKSPIKEELFANKWCTLLYRRTSRDLFDVYQITKVGFDRTVFRKCAIIDSLMRGKPKLYEINIGETISKIRADSSLKNLLQTEKYSKFNFNEMTEQTAKFSKSIMTNLAENEMKAIDQFFELRTFEPNLIDKKGIFHEKIKDHPAILWTLANLA
jgi:hypothetical protein